MFNSGFMFMFLPWGNLVNPIIKEVVKFHIINKGTNGH